MAVQPDVAESLSEIEPILEWVLGRDGTLTAREPEGRWWAGCSVPLLAGRALLSTLDADPQASCLLSPSHVGLVLASRERMGARPALFVVEPDIQTARVILTCHDLSADIQAHRLWFSCGNDWAGQLREIFTSYPGLATPARFIRTKLTASEVADGLIGQAQTVFSSVLEQRAKAIAAYSNSEAGATESTRILLIGESHFQLWNDATRVLNDELADRRVQRFDTDDPLATSPIALLEAARTCGSIVTADICRADSTNAVRADLPWITWMTRPAAPEFGTAGPRDYLILADSAWRSIARSAGWPDDRVRVCGWPAKSSTTPTAPSRSPKLAIICDTQLIKIPHSIEDFSSHRVLWEMVETELHETPLTVEDPDKYLRDRANQLHIDLPAHVCSAFVRGLIIPAFQQGLARILINAGLPVSIWGDGWREIAEVAGHSEGALIDRDSFDAAVSASTALIYCWPVRAAHPIETTGKPVLYRNGRETALLTRDAKKLLDAPASSARAETTSGHLGKLIQSVLET
jgi:hypothetical protein